MKNWDFCLREKSELTIACERIQKEEPYFWLIIESYRDCVAHVDLYYIGVKYSGLSVNLLEKKIE